VNTTVTCPQCAHVFVPAAGEPVRVTESVDVEYADPGYQADKKTRYPLDTERHIRAAWTYINQSDNAEAYTAAQLKTIKSKIKAAMRRIGAQVTEAVIDGERSFDDIRELVRAALAARMRQAIGASYCWAYVADLSAEQVVYSSGDDDLYQCSYQVADDGTVALGDPVQVVRTYAPAGAAIDDGSGAAGGDGMPGDAMESFDSAAHPHAPAGSATGGEFTDSGGSGGSSKKGGAGKTSGHPGGTASKPGSTGTLAYDAASKSGAGYDARGGDARVKTLQTSLNRLGVSDSAGKKLAVDGKFGPLTTQAVKALQKRLGLAQDGKITPDLLKKVTAMKTLPPAPAKKTATRAKTSEDATADRVTETELGHVVEAKGTDDAGGRIYRVRIIAYGDSRNARRYPAAVLQEALSLYEGARAYDHHRSTEELASGSLAGLCGSYRNVAAEADGIYGDLHLLPSATHVAESIDASLDAQEQGLPPLVGISHDVKAHFRPLVADGRRLQEATQIVDVQSADVVSTPAAGGKAVRAVAGGTDTEPKEPDVTLDELLALLKTASPEQLKESLGAAPATETIEANNGGQPPAGELKTSFIGSLMIERKIEAAGLPKAVVDSLTAELPERITESDIDAKIASLKSMAALFERPDLRPTVTTQVVKEAQEKVVEGLDKFFAGDYSVFRSFKQAHAAYTGYRPRVWGEDENRVVLRESIGSLYDSATRSTESMTTASWDQVLGDSITRRLIASYTQPSLRSWEAIVSDRVPVNDFRTQRRTRVGGYGTLPVVAQGAPYQPLTSPTDEEATYTLEKKGGTEDLTFEMVANDDVGAIRMIPTRLGLAAARTLHNFVWDFLATNPTIYDSVALFHASHTNTTAVALSQSNMSSLRQKMRDQTGYGDTSNILSLVPRYLIVPNELEELAFQICTSAVAIPGTPAGPSDTPNVHQGTKPIVVDYFTDSNDWYVSCDPQLCPTIELGFYQGREEPELFTQADPSVGSMFNSDTITYKIRHMYKGAVIEYRGFQRGTQ
jgi:peptidoglycan hydrolase-like protein with peptidoglycan-binding domain